MIFVNDRTLTKITVDENPYVVELDVYNDSVRPETYFSTTPGYLVVEVYPKFSNEPVYITIEYFSSLNESAKVITETHKLSTDGFIVLTNALNSVLNINGSCKMVLKFYK